MLGLKSNRVSKRSSRCRRNVSLKQLLFPWWHMSQIPLFSLKPDGIPENSLTPRRVSHGISPWPSSACSVHVWPETGKVKQIFFKASLFIADFDHFFGQTTLSKIAEEITRKLTTIQLFLDQDGSVPADDNFMNTPLGTNVRISTKRLLHTFYWI